MSKEQKEVGFRLAIFIAALVIMILIAGFGFQADEERVVADDNTELKMSTNE